MWVCCAQSLIFCVGVYGPLLIFLFACLSLYCYVTARRGHARMVVGFTTTYAISAYHHWCLWVWNSIRTRCTTLCDEICQWLATGLLFSSGPPFPPPIKQWWSTIAPLSSKGTITSHRQTHANTQVVIPCTCLNSCRFETFHYILFTFSYFR